MTKISVRFYEELNDFLPENKRKKEIELNVPDKAEVQDILNIFQIPSKEVHLVLINGENSLLDTKLNSRDRISVYPLFETIDILPIKLINNPRIKEALLWKKEKNVLKCLTCERKCKILPDRLGVCKTRKNIGGKLYTLIYGDISSVSANPIEKKPLFHFHPGTKALTVGSWSCNFTCPWCQNDDISKSQENIGRGEYISPEKFIELMEIYECQGTSISFNEPTLLLEYSLDVFKLAKRKKYYNTYVSNGYMTMESLKAMIDAGLDAINIDIKGDRETVKRYCGADSEKIWKNMVEAKKQGIWIELTTLIIPGVNDDEKKIRNISKRIREEIGDTIPWHITRYYPAYQFNRPSPSVKKLEMARAIGIDTGLKYVYIGNVWGHKYENTYCPECKEILIKRAGINIIENKLKNKRNCPSCGYKIYIIQ